MAASYAKGVLFKFPCWSQTELLPWSPCIGISRGWFSDLSIVEKLPTMLQKSFDPMTHIVIRVTHRGFLNVWFKNSMGRLGGSVGWAADFGSGHGLAVCEFKPRVGLCADSSEPGACFEFCVSLSLWPSPTHTLCCSKIIKIKQKSKHMKRNLKKNHW